MKKRFLALVLCLLMATPACAADLVSDPQPDVTYHDIEINGAVISDHPAAADGSVFFNVDHLASGQTYTFRARAKRKLGSWPSEWSAPYEDSKPGGVTGLRIK